MATDDNLKPFHWPVQWKRFEKGPSHGIFNATFTSGGAEYIYRGPDMFYMLSSEGNQGVFVMQLFQQSDDVHTPAMLK